MEDLLLALGLVLFILGLLTGLAVPLLKNPRMGLAGHLAGVTNGPFLMVAGLMWPRIELSHAMEVTTVVLLTYGGYANWLAMQLGSWWGAGRKFAPGAAGEHRASAGKERVVDLLLATLAPATLIGAVILLIGLLR